jgi:predicted TPR repeat methyltransferase
MLANIEGAATNETAYVSGLYDAYAAEFDEHLTRQLGYDIPAAIRQAVEGLLPRPVPALDLGCGTGLVADALEGRFSSIDGIDLSPAMVDRARRRKLYRELAVGDLADLTGKPPFGGPYGLVTAADVFIHVPDLQPVFAAISASLTAGGLFAFSTEKAEAPVSLRSSGRFAHGTGHVRHLAATHRFDLVADIVVTIRLERLRPVPGRLFVLRKKTGGASA